METQQLLKDYISATVHIHSKTSSKHSRTKKKKKSWQKHSCLKPVWGWEQNHIKITIQKVWKLYAGVWKCFFSIRKKFQLPSFAQQSKAAIKLWVWSYKEMQTFKELLPGLIPKLWGVWLWTDNSGGWSTLLHMHLHSHTRIHTHTPVYRCVCVYACVMCTGGCCSHSASHTLVEFPF